MMPKEAVADRGIREEVVSTLTVLNISSLLRRFRPDEYAPNPLPMGAPSAVQRPSYSWGHARVRWVTQSVSGFADPAAQARQYKT